MGTYINLYYNSKHILKQKFDYFNMIYVLSNSILFKCNLKVEMPTTPKTPSAPAEELDKSLATINDAITALNNEGIKNSNIVVGGFSQGGSMAMYAALTKSGGT